MKLTQILKDDISTALRIGKPVLYVLLLLLFYVIPLFIVAYYYSDIDHIVVFGIVWWAILSYIISVHQRMMEGKKWK